MAVYTVSDNLPHELYGRNCDCCRAACTSAPTPGAEDFQLYALERGAFPAVVSGSRFNLILSVWDI